ncbi:MAG TPA: ECF transporter S component [Ruminiclostridium sp.]|nr:ECF transporter S component [Ruminiclostridium sp.]
MNNAVNGIRNEKSLKLVQLAMWTALTVLLAFVPSLGYITIGPFSITTVHIPVIIGAIMLGPAAGAFLGFMFGLTSVIQATLQVPLTAFIFSPFVPFGNFTSLIIAFVPRILVGVVAGYLYILISKKDKRGYISALAAGIAGSLTNTILVLGGAYLFFGSQYSAAVNVPFKSLLWVILSVVGTNGILEAAVAAVAAAAVSKALFTVKKRMG